MPDREKVIQGLCDAIGIIHGYVPKRYWGYGEQACRDALSLLKEQEPVAPVLVGRMWECGKCHAPVGIFMDDQRDQFCRTCGRSVKWE